VGCQVIGRALFVSRQVDAGGRRRQQPATDPFDKLAAAEKLATAFRRDQDGPVGLCGQVRKSVSLLRIVTDRENTTVVTVVPSDRWQPGVAHDPNFRLC
jgi:hypothetical protein